MPNQVPQGNFFQTQRYSLLCGMLGIAGQLHLLEYTVIHRDGMCHMFEIQLNRLQKKPSFGNCSSISIKGVFQSCKVIVYY